jgi:hypothetical protein
VGKIAAVGRREVLRSHPDRALNCARALRSGGASSAGKRLFDVLLPVAPPRRHP